MRLLGKYLRVTIFPTILNSVVQQILSSAYMSGTYLLNEGIVLGVGDADMRRSGFYPQEAH